jgi:hypothetical protein
MVSAAVLPPGFDVCASIRGSFPIFLDRYGFHTGHSTVTNRIFQLLVDRSCRNTASVILWSPASL